MNNPRVYRGPMPSGKDRQIPVEDAPRPPMYAEMPTWMRWWALDTGPTTIMPPMIPVQQQEPKT